MIFSGGIHCVFIRRISIYRNLVLFATITAPSISALFGVKQFLPLDNTLIEVMTVWGIIGYVVSFAAILIFSLIFKKPFKIEPIQISGENIWSMDQKASSPSGRDRFFVKVHFNLWTQYSIGIINIDLRYKQGSASPREQNIVLDNMKYETDGSYRMTNRKKVDAKGVVDVFISRYFTCGFDKCFDLGPVEISMKLIGSPWHGEKTLKINGKLVLKGLQIKTFGFEK